MSSAFTILDPAPEQVAIEVSKGVAEGRLITLLCLCSIDYSGRSSSKLGSGDRLVIIKSDRSILVHRKSGLDAVNWQPPGSVITVSQGGDVPVIKAYRPKQRETLKLSLEKVYLLASMRLVDDARFEMLMDERELYHVILHHPELIEEGLRITSSQKEIGEGIADFSAVDVNGNYVVVEVKKDPVGPEAVRQLYKYVSELRKTSNVRGLLLSPSIKKAAKSLLASLNLEFNALNLKECARLLEADRERFSEKLDKHFSG
ncbi:MAG: endonuclease NucS [Thaumarchaeota archaeon]|nr:endonuclease NucS [Nitrososphaerota archaeon]